MYNWNTIVCIQYGGQRNMQFFINAHNFDQMNNILYTMYLVYQHRFSSSTNPMGPHLELLNYS